MTDPSYRSNEKSLLCVWGSVCAQRLTQMLPSVTPQLRFLRKGLPVPGSHIFGKVGQPWSSRDLPASSPLVLVQSTSYMNSRDPNSGSHA